MAEMRGVLTRVERNGKGYVWIEIEQFRYEASNIDDERFERWRSLLDKKVVAVVHPWPIRTEDGRVRIVGKVSGLYEVRDGEA
jgi:3-phenylpropionate/cinnamic acid dioxygenase small subunit